jgi:hypothetical protein
MMTGLWSRWRNEPQTATELDVFRKLKISHFVRFDIIICSLQRPRGLRRGSATTSLPGLRVRIPSGQGRLSECCLLLGRGLCNGPITRPELSSRLLCV